MLSVETDQMEEWPDLKDILIGLQTGGSKIATGLTNLAQTMLNNLPESNRRNFRVSGI
jgi:hypothetical protein